MQSSISNLTIRVEQVEERTDTIEGQVSDYSEANNELVDAFECQTEDLCPMTAKNNDLEDRSIWNNIKFCGIPESIKPAKLTTYLQHLFLKLLPHLTTIDLTIDRAHRIPKPQYLPTDVPRDVLALINFYHLTDQILRAYRSSPRLPEPHTRVSLFAGISAAMARRPK